MGIQNTAGTGFESIVAGENQDLSSAARIVTLAEYLLLLLVLFYLAMPGVSVENKFIVILVCMAFVVFVIVFHMIFHPENTINRHILAAEAIVITIFITFVLWHTGKASSPLSDLYLIVIILTAIVLGKTTSMLLLGLIASALLYLNYAEYSLDLFSAPNLSQLIKSLVTLFTFLLISYVTIMLATKMEEARCRVKMLSEHDELTNLWNMRAFSDFLELEIVKSERHKRKFAVLMVDADNLKHINDKYGHKAGDDLIKSLADTLSETVRTSDIVARYGGDEFIILLSEVDKEMTMMISERIREAVKIKGFTIYKKEIPVAVSIGAASYPDDSIVPQELIKMADSALYESKKAGKNKITFA